ncbi:hypothetical protein ACI3KW_13060 [Devosia sp. ZW T5_3]|uniref:hypothetical protein n=1 Tax=Devosia sp. ZW T5_3 TaxID=3378085 RepID=UPI003852E193
MSRKRSGPSKSLGCPIATSPVGGSHGGLDTPAYCALNPNGVVPTLQDGDLTVWESHATVGAKLRRYRGGRVALPLVHHGYRASCHA